MYTISTLDNFGWRTSTACTDQRPTAGNHSNHSNHSSPGTTQHCNNRNNRNCSSTLFILGSRRTSSRASTTLDWLIVVCYLHAKIESSIYHTYTNTPTVTAPAMIIASPPDTSQDADTSHDARSYRFGHVHGLTRILGLDESVIVGTQERCQTRCIPTFGMARHASYEYFQIIPSFLDEFGSESIHHPGPVLVREGRHDRPGLFDVQSIGEPFEVGISTQYRGMGVGDVVF